MALVFGWQHQFLISCSQVILGCSVIAASELGLPGQGFLLARGEGAAESEKHAWGSRAWQSSCFGSQGLCADVFSRWMPIQGCSKDALAKLKWHALSQSSQGKDGSSGGKHYGAAASKFLLWWFCILVQVLFPLMVFGNHTCGSQIPWKFSSLTNGCWEGEVVTSSSSFCCSKGPWAALLDEFLNTKLKLFKQPPGDCSIHLIFWLTR